MCFIQRAKKFHNNRQGNPSTTSTFTVEPESTGDGMDKILLLYSLINRIIIKIGLS